MEPDEYFDQQWEIMTKQLNDAISHLHNLIELEGECKYTDYGFCYTHNMDALCPVDQAQVWLEGIQ